MHHEDQTADPCHYRQPGIHDGKAIWQLAVDSGKLDINSAYCYIMLCEYFADTCVVAEVDGKMVGFVTGYYPPGKPKTLFVWQIAVASAHRGGGIADGLLEHLLSSPSGRRAQFIETTISPSNKASLRLFDKLAVKLAAPSITAQGFSASLFPNGVHEDENLIRIGPLKERGTYK
jgi:L-2,4-diaminobutyric acid acetyltransferase